MILRRLISWWCRRPAQSLTIEPTATSTLSPEQITMLRRAAHRAVEGFHDVLTVAAATDAHGPLSAHGDAVFRQLTASPAVELLAALDHVPPAQRDDALARLLVILFCELLDRDVVGLRQRQEVSW